MARYRMPQISVNTVFRGKLGNKYLSSGGHIRLHSTFWSLMHKHTTYSYMSCKTTPFEGLTLTLTYQGHQRSCLMSATDKPRYSFEIWLWGWEAKIKFGPTICSLLQNAAKWVIWQVAPPPGENYKLSTWRTFCVSLNEILPKVWE